MDAISLVMQTVFATVLLASQSSEAENNFLMFTCVSFYGTYRILTAYLREIIKFKVLGLP